MHALSCVCTFVIIYVLQITTQLYHVFYNIYHKYPHTHVNIYSISIYTHAYNVYIAAYTYAHSYTKEQKIL